MDTKSLKQAGLTEGEIKTYLALLELGPSTSGPIIEKSGVARSIIYKILERLAQKGLVSFIVKGKTRYFQAEEPSRIMDYLEKRESEFKENKKNVEAVIPQLTQMALRAGERNEVRIYQGFKGMVTSHERMYNVLKKGEEYYSMGIAHNQPEHYHEFWKKDHQRRVKAGLRCRLLFDAKTQKEVLDNRNRFPGCEARYTPVETTTPAWFMGYANVITIHAVSENPITVEITSREIADSFKSYFEKLWEMSKKV